MKKFFLAILAIGLLFGVQQSNAQDRYDHRTFGLGIMVGEPSGLSAKLWTSPTTAFDFGLGWSVRNDQVDNGIDAGDRTHFHMDYLWHSFDAFHSEERFPLYYGVGGSINSGGGFNSALAVRGVIGVAWMPMRTPIDVFLEVVPTFQLTATSGLYVDASLGARYYF
ncbi:MAG TPA: hypothetical protein VKS81_01890 [Bacteroidota bacterium]|nr:hypothetical protein [Bacteroidota bacterium]